MHCDTYGASCSAQRRRKTLQHGLAAKVMHSYKETGCLNDLVSTLCDFDIAPSYPVS